MPIKKNCESDVKDRGENGYHSAESHGDRSQFQFTALFRPPHCILYFDFSPLDIKEAFGYKMKLRQKHVYTEAWELLQSFPGLGWYLVFISLDSKNSDDPGACCSGRSLLEAIMGQVVDLNPLQVHWKSGRVAAITWH